MRYRFIQAEKASYPVEVLCQVLAVARSGYYAWCRRPASVRAQQNQWLVTHIRTCYQASRGRYGSPRIHQDLRAHGVRVGRHRVARLMRLHGLRSVRRRRSLEANRHGTLPGSCAANILRREFAATRPNEKWAGDITYVPTRQGWLYVAVLMDLYSRRIVGWAMDEQMTTTLTLRPSRWRCSNAPCRLGLLHHSDRGSQYGAMAYQQRLVDPRHPVLDEPSRQLLGQRRGGELLRHAENGIALRRAPVSDPAGSPHGDLCVSGGIL